MTNEEIIRFLLESQKSLDSNLHTVVENIGKLEANVSKVVETMDRLEDNMERIEAQQEYIQANMREWHEDRQQMNKTMLAVFDRMDTYASAAEQRSQEADARMLRLEKLLGRAQNGHNAT